MTTDTFSPAQNAPFSFRPALLLGLLCFLASLFCLELAAFGNKISPIWYASAIMTVAVFRCRGPSLALILAACLFGTLCANLLMFGLHWSLLAFSLINLLQGLTGGLLLRILLRPDAPLDSLMSWCKMVVAVGILMPLLGALAAIWWLHIIGGAPTLHFFLTWILAEVIGMLALGPVCLLWQPGYLRQQAQQHALLEPLATLVFSLLLCCLALRFLPWPFTFVIVILFWAAVRLPRLEAFFVFFANISLASLLLAFNLIELHTVNSAFRLTAPWLPFLLVLIPSHIMTMVMFSFREEKKHISESEQRFRNAMEYSAIGMALVTPNGNWLQVNQALCRLLGYQPHALQKLSWQQITWPDDLAADLQQAESLLRGEQNYYTLEKRYIRQDGEVVWVLQAVSLMRDLEGNPLYFISQIEDISGLKQSQAENQRLMERITLANEAGGIGVWEWNVATNEMSWDKRMFAIYELELTDRPTYKFWLRRLHPDDRPMAEEAVRRALEEGEPFTLECRILTRHGIRYIRSQADSLLSPEGDITRMLGINQDVTELRMLTEALYQEKERMHITLDAIGEAVISTDEELRVTFMNPVAEQMSGWTQEQAEGKPISDILRITHGAHGPEMENILRSNLPQNATVTELDRDLILHNASGEQFAIHYSLTPLKTLTGENIGSVLVIQDVSESREMLKRLHYSASHDMLTRLPNRTSFEHQLKRLLLSAAEQQHVLAFIDLDRFKAVNDSAGHAAGDALLRELAEIMSHLLRGNDFLARLGGDEFGLLLPDCGIGDASNVVQRIVTAINDYRFLWEGKLHRIGASAGLTQIDAHNNHSSEVLAQADLACYNAKHNGRGQLSVYETRLQQSQAVTLSHEDIVRLIEQPMRWQAWAVCAPHTTQSANFHLLQPRLTDSQGHEIDVEAFRASLADEALCERLDRALLDSFFSRHATGVAHKALNVVLPLSGESLLNSRTLSQLIDTLAAGPLRGERVIISLETSALLNHTEALRPVLLQLRQLGCPILLRHFGRNLEAFERLPQADIDFLQLAPDLIANVHFSLMDEMLVSIIHGQAQRLNIATVAGPVELPVALTTLASIGINAVWGPAVNGGEPLCALLENSFFAIK